MKEKLTLKNFIGISFTIMVMPHKLGEDLEKHLTNLSVMTEI